MLPKENNKKLLKICKCFVLSESYIRDTIKGCFALEEGLEVSYKVSFPEVSIAFRASSSLLLEESFVTVINALGKEHVFSTDDNASMASVVQKLCIDKKQTISFAESCTGGLASHLVVSESGASQYFCSSIVAYSNDVKEKVLAVSPDTLTKYGSVSAQTAIEMAKGVRELTGTSIGVSVTGIAGPGGGTKEKPVGTVFFGFASSEKEYTLAKHYVSNRNEFRRYCAYNILDIVRRSLLGYY